jgi:hypothetical protein
VIGIKDDGFESLRYKLRSMSEVQLVQFGKDARKRFLTVQKELELAKQEWLARHPRRRHHRWSTLLRMTQRKLPPSLLGSSFN